MSQGKWWAIRWNLSGKKAVEDEVEVWQVIAQVRSQLLSAESFWRLRVYFQLVLQGYFKISSSADSISLNDDAYLHRHFARLFQSAYMQYTWTLISVKQIGIFRQKMHEVRVKAATNDALWLEMCLDISTNIHIYKNSLLRQGGSRMSIESSHTNQTEHVFLRVIFSRSPHLSGDLLHEIN